MQAALRALLGRGQKIVSKILYDQVLNPAQLEAVRTLEGPVLVIAGAGSGKTRTLVYRVARLVESGVPPENILLLTFTRKAAGEMLERAVGLSDERCQRVSGGTFHSLSHRVLRSHADQLGFQRTFTVLDRSDMEEILQSLAQGIKVEKRSIRFPKRATVATILSKAANLQISPAVLVGEEYAQFIEHAQEISLLADLYWEHKRESQLMDYDDLLLLFRELLREKETVRNHLNEQYRYIMVDEYQDTNAIQADIITYLAGDHGNVMVVGDDSQSIYSFRGANYENMFDFPKSFPSAKIVKLEENYRSTQPILSLTNAIMAQAREKYTKCLHTCREGGDIPEVVDTRTERGQARFVCESILNAVRSGRSLKDFAVLFRAGYHSFELEVQLAKQGIPFVKYGGFKFVESAHIKDLLAHLRVQVNRNDTVSWGRILRLLKNIGQRKSQAIIKWMKESGSTQNDVGTWPGGKKEENALKDLSRLFEQLSQRGLSPEKAVSLALAYYGPILEEKFDDFPRRQKDLEQLTVMAGRYRSLRTFLDELVLDPPNSITDVGSRGSGENLTLSTVHSAKGLEWPVVFVIWVADGYFPPMKTLADESAMEEERRLLYVAATRAKDRLVFCYPGQEISPAWNMPEFRYRGGLSTFLQSLPDDVVAHRQSPSLGISSDFQSPKKRRSRSGNPDEGRGLRPGDRVRHPAFGQGVIAKFLDPQKVEVLFRDVGKKLLHLAYTTLEKI